MALEGRSGWGRTGFTWGAHVGSPDNSAKAELPEEEAAHCTVLRPSERDEANSHGMEMAILSGRNVGCEQQTLLRHN